MPLLIGGEMRKDDVLKNLPKGFSEGKPIEEYSDNPRFILKARKIAARYKGDTE